jgi:phosphodiesterase/alkaline phosphatase D-like protein
MITRRLFLRTSALSLIGITSGIAKATPPSPQITATALHGYALTNGATALRRDDGAWVFWVRIINFENPNSDIAASLQLATDKGFSQITDVLPVILTKTKSFIAQTVYMPKAGNIQLYYRYVVGSSTSTAPSVSSSVNSIAPWNTESKAE